MRAIPVNPQVLGRSLRVFVIGRFHSIHAVRFAEELQRQGLEVAAMWLGGGVCNPRVRTIYHPQGSARMLGIPRTATLVCLLYIRQAINEFRPDIIHIQDDPRIPYWLNMVCRSKI